MQDLTPHAVQGAGIAFSADAPNAPEFLGER